LLVDGLAFSFSHGHIHKMYVHNIRSVKKTDHARQTMTEASDAKTKQGTYYLKEDAKDARPSNCWLKKREEKSAVEVRS
jgi:hypothetical protein